MLIKSWASTLKNARTYLYIVYVWPSNFYEPLQQSRDYLEFTYGETSIVRLFKMYLLIKYWTESWALL